MHPMLSSVVHLPFLTASKEIGCCEFNEQDFSRAITPHLQTLSTELPMENLDTHKLWHSMMTGEVIAVECLEVETLLFHVRGRVTPKYIDMKFSYNKDNWDINSITSIHSRPLWYMPSRRLYLGMAGGAVLAALVGFFLAGQGTPLNPQTVEAWAAANGYQLVKQGAALTTAAASNLDPNQPQPTQPFSSGDAKQVPSTSAKPADAHALAKPSASTTAKTKSVPQTFTFDLRAGMTVQDISVFLAQHHLVANAVAFDQVLKQTGVDKKVWPGTYTFKSGMTQSQILQELQSKPSH